MKTYLISAALTLALAGAAQATPPGNNGGGNGGCGVGQQTNGCGGQGGAGGDGGNAAQQQGQQQGQAQGQQQGQAQGQSQTGVLTNINAPHTSATGIGLGGDAKAVSGALSGSVSESTSSSGAIATTSASVGHVLATTGASTSSANGNGAGQTTTFTQNYEATRRAAASAYAAPAQIGSLVCGISKASVAVQLPGFGGSGNGAVIDKGCERRSTADVFARLGMAYEACLIMVRDPVAVATGLNASVCERTLPVVVSSEAPVPVPAPKPAATMAPVPNPVPVNDGERG